MKKGIIAVLVVAALSLLGVGLYPFFSRKAPVVNSKEWKAEITGAPAVEVQEDQDDKFKIKRIIQAYKERNDQLLLEGQRLLREKKIDEAIHVFQQAMDGASDPRPYASLINIYLHLGREEDAYRILEKAGYYKTDMNWLVNEFDLKQFPKTTPESSEVVAIAPFKDNKAAAITFTFDDGPKSVYTQGLPLFDTYGFKASIFVNPGFIRGDETHPAHGRWDDWRDAHRRGFEISNHGLDHLILPELDEEELERQVNYAHDVIAQEIGEAPASFVFPQDLHDQRTVEKALEKHLVVRQHGFLRQVYTSVMTPFYGGEYFSLASANKLVDWSIDRRVWLIPVCHALPVEGIESYKPITMEFLRDHLAYIHEHEKDIWVDNFINVYKYLLLRSKTQVRLIDQQDRSVVFALDNSTLVPSIPTLTVVVDTSPRKAREVTARHMSSGQELSCKIDGQRIILDVAPDGESVQVEWK